MVLHRHVLSLDVAGFVEALAKRSDSARIRRPAVDKSDNRHRRLLRPRRNRPNRRAAEQCDELAALHSITSSGVELVGRRHDGINSVST